MSNVLYKTSTTGDLVSEEEIKVRIVMVYLQFEKDKEYLKKIKQTMLDQYGLDVNSKSILRVIEEYKHDNGKYVSVLSDKIKNQKQLIDGNKDIVIADNTVELEEVNTDIVDPDAEYVRLQVIGELQDNILTYLREKGTKLTFRSDREALQFYQDLINIRRGMEEKTTSEGDGTEKIFKTIKTIISEEIEKTSVSIKKEKKDD